MRFTKFLAATMAAMTIVSCSEQVEDFGVNAQPGDAVLSFKVGTKGGTTYATSDEESKVNSLVGFLAYKNGEGKETLKQIVSKEGALTKLDINISDGEYTPGPATMYFVANMPAVKDAVDSEAALNAFTDAKTLYTNVGGVLTLDASGMSATHKITIDLKPGMVTEDVSLKRLAARVYAVSGNTGANDIADYKVDFEGTKANSTLFTYTGGGTGVAPDPYVIKGESAGQYEGLEAVGYVYPSAEDVTIKVSNKDNSSNRTVKFKPEANKNYKLIITPSTPGKPGADPKFTVSIVGYENGDDLNVDFGPLKVSSTAVLPTNFKAGAGGVLEITGAAGTESAGVKVKFADLFKDTPAASLQTFQAVSASTLALGADYKISSDGMFAIGDTDSDGLYFFASKNEGADKTYVATFIGWDGTNDSSKQQYTINVVRKSANTLPENFTTTIDGVEFMSVAWQGDMDATKKLVADINNMAGADFVEKTLAFSKVSAANLALLAGKKYQGVDIFNSLKGTAICPAGFTLPSKAQVTRLFQFTKFDATQPTKTLVEGINTFGDNVINYKVTYSTIEDKAGNRLFIPNQTNFVTDIIHPNAAFTTVLRVIFWNNNFQFVEASTKVQNSYVRCVKVPQS